MIRVGRAIYGKAGNVTYPSYEGFTPIVVMMRSHSIYHSLSPYMLKDDENRTMENIWQFSKIYETVPKTTQRYSRWNQTVIWSYPKERHVDENGEILPGYWKWRRRGMKNKYAVRYPVGYQNRSKCLYAIPEYDLDAKLDYIESRRKIYIPEYCRLAKEDPISFPDLKARLENGENILIIEPDGPHQESLDYYKREYGVANDFIEDHTMLVTEQNITTMALDQKHPFGHGFCLGMALLDMDQDLLDFWDDILEI